MQYPAHSIGHDLRARLDLAVNLLATHPSRAEALARAVLADAPDQPDASLVLGTALRAQDHLNQAHSVLEPLAARQPGSWTVQFELALVLLTMGRGAAAIKPLEGTVMLHPRFAPGWRKLGEQLLLAGQARSAENAYAGLIRATLRNTALAPAADALFEGDLKTAETILRKRSERHWTASAWRVMAEVARRQDRWDDAATFFLQGLQHDPDDDDARLSFVRLLCAQHKFALAHTEIRRLLQREPQNVSYRALCAMALSGVSDHAAAAECRLGLAFQYSDHAHLWLICGHDLRILAGRTTEAVAAYRRAIALRPNFGEAYWALANLKTYRFTPKEVEAMRAELPQSNLPPIERSHLHFALGKADEDSGRYAEAIEHYSRGNRIRRERRSYDTDRTHRLVEDSTALLTAGFFADRQGVGATASDPIFIVGLPRAGSTLVEQILSSHSAIEGTRELPDVEAIARWIGRGHPRDYTEALARIPHEQLALIGGDYLKSTAIHRRLDRAHFIDKAPNNFRHVGLIHLILPNAKIIDARRHPLACCVSAFKHAFAPGVEFSDDLADLGRYYRDYVELMAHYDAVLPRRVHRVIYERLVADPEQEVRSLLGYLGLPFEEACLRYYENDRDVRTFSSEQVRQPIYADKLESWRPFEPWLGGLKAALGAALDTWAGTHRLDRGSARA